MQKKKSRRKEKICVGVIGYAIFLIYSMWPVYRLRDGYHSFYGVFRLLSQKGAAALTDSCRDVWDGNMGAIKDSGWPVCNYADRGSIVSDTADFKTNTGISCRL